MNKYKISEPDDVRSILFRESLDIAQGFTKEVFFNKRSKTISFSGNETRSTFHKDADVIGRINSFNINELEHFHTINDDFVEVDDEDEETDPEFKDTEYERYFNEYSSIITREDALDRIESMTDEWYSDIVAELEERMPKKKESA